MLIETDLKSSLRSNHYGSKQPDFPEFDNSLPHELGSEWASELASKLMSAAERVIEASRESGANEWAKGRVSGPVRLDSWLFVEMERGDWYGEDGR